MVKKNITTETSFWTKVSIVFIMMFAVVGLGVGYWVLFQLLGI